MTIPVAVVAGFALPVSRSFGVYGTHGFNGVANELMKSFTGYANDGTWDFQRLKFGTLPVVLGITVHKVMSALGVNRLLASTGIPLIRI